MQISGAVGLKVELEIYLSCLLAFSLSLVLSHSKSVCLSLTFLLPTDTHLPIAVTKKEIIFWIMTNLLTRLRKKSSMARCAESVSLTKMRDLFSWKLACEDKPYWTPATSAAISDQLTSTNPSFAAPRSCTPKRSWNTLPLTTLVPKSGRPARKPSLVVTYYRTDTIHLRFFSRLKRAAPVVSP